MKLNKKAFMLSAQELVKLLITLLVVVFFITCVSKAFVKVDSAAERSFGDFVKEVNDLGKNGQEGEKRSFILTLGEDDLIANFWSDNSDEFIRCSTMEEHWTGPGVSCHGNDCICLIRDWVREETKNMGTFCDPKNPLKIWSYMPTMIRCIEIPQEYYVYGMNWREEWNTFGENPESMKMVIVKKKNIVFISKDKESPITEDHLNYPHPTKHVKK